MLDDFLLQVNKPARYIGQEWNVSKKDFDQAYIRFALCFPDLYEIGMSNLGTRIIYGILNDIADVCCERFFSPDIDMQRVLANQHIDIFSLESKKKLKDFDLLGFSLGYELAYTNVLNILDLGQIPLESSRRDNRYPLVIGGGPCVANPEPMHEFFDFFVIGEAEDVILEIVEVYRKFKHQFKTSKMSKQDLLMMFSQIEGVYVPSFYDPRYTPEGKIGEFKPRFKGITGKIKKRFVRDLDKAYFPVNWLLPYIQTVHDRLAVEIMRGCPNTCRFCQARSYYFPTRIRQVKNVVDLACNTYRDTGYEEISLAGLSVSDYIDIEELLKLLVGLFKTKGVAISLPSVKPKTILGDISHLVATIKKTGLTFAPEAATERLRKILDKDFELDDFFKAIEQAYASGWRHIKLYFMIGLPNETDKDLDGILDFATSVSELRKKVDKIPAQVNISINTLVPKPHTPFQWFGMQDLESIRYKQVYLKKKIKNKRLKLSFHNPAMSFLEGVLSRGDRRLSRVILAAFRRGCRFDAWANHFNFTHWLDAFNECDIEPYFYLQERPTQDYLPWDFLDLGISKEFLVSEFNKTIAMK